MNPSAHSGAWRAVVACATAFVSYCVGALATGLASVITVFAGAKFSTVSQAKIEFYRVSTSLVLVSGALVALFLLIESRWVRIWVGIWIGAIITAAVALFANDIRETWPQALGLLVVAGGLAWATLRLAPRRPHESGT